MTTKEEENFIRMALLLTGISHKAVRAYFDVQFAPTCLDRTFRKDRTKLNNLKTKHVITAKQWDLLFPINGQPADSAKFDITLMITLLKNLAPIDVPDQPADTDTSIEADLGRIKYYRNHLAHLNDSRIEHNEFEIMWSSIAKAVKTLGGNLMYEKALTLKTDVLDKQLSEENAELRQTLYTLRQQLNDPVRNIREIIQSEIDVWKNDDEVFVITSAAKTILQLSEENFCVTIIGSSGMGKTAILRHVALKMADKGYDLIPVQEPGEIKQYYNPNTKTVFVIDNLCGKFSAQKSEVERWEHFLSHFSRFIKKDVVKIMISCRLQVFKDKLFDTLTLFKSCVCDLTSKTFKLSDQDLKSIAEAYVNNPDEVVQYAHLYDCFPLLCKRYKECPLLGLDIFRNPYSVYENELKQMFAQQNYNQYCALVLCVMFNNCVNEECLRDNIDSGLRAIFENTFEECKLNRGTSRLVILDSFETLLNTYLIKTDTVYKVVHDKLFDIISHFVGKKMLKCLIRNANIKLIGERFVFHEPEEVKEHIIKVPLTLLDLYIRRMMDDWLNGNVTDVFSNINFPNKQFLESFCQHVTSLETSKQVQLAKIVDRFNTSVLHLCCGIGDFKCTKWALENGALVNISDDNKMSPLLVAALKGHVNIVKLLIDNNACVNDTTIDNITSLFIACENGRLELLNILLQSNADLNICTKNDGMSPLFAASHMGCLEIVERILQEKKTDINKGTTNNGITPLYEASAKGHTEVVKILLYYKADIDKCTTDTGATPLHIACQQGHNDIVNILLDNNACINSTTSVGMTAINIACINNRRDVVKVLLQRNADVNICTKDDEFSPLYEASGRGFSEIVLQILQAKRADINKGTTNGLTPLFGACTNGHVQVVKMLLNNKAEVDKCTTDMDHTPLFAACQKGEIEIVTNLIKNKASINKCTTNGETPLFGACLNGHKNIVDILLKNGADINMCSKDIGATPLFVASYNGYKDIVKILLENGADIYKRTTEKGVSPIDIAFIKNHRNIYLMIRKKDYKQSCFIS